MDPVGRDLSFASAAEGTVLGVPVRIRATDAAALTAARGLWDSGAPASAGTEPAPSIEVRVFVVGDPAAFPSASLGGGSWVPDRERLVLVERGVIGFVDAGRRDAVVYVEPSMVGRPQHLEDQVFRPILLFLVTWHDRCPLHASAIDGPARTVLLMGPSGAGKSSVAYAASADGMTVLADDAVYVQLRPRRVVWAISEYLELTAGSVEHFPELRSRSEERAVGAKIRIPLSRTRSAIDGPVGICFLKGAGEGVAVRPISEDEAVSAAQQTLAPGFDRFREDLPDVVRGLAAEAFWEVTTGQSPLVTWRAIRPLFDPSHTTTQV